MFNRKPVQLTEDERREYGLVTLDCPECRADLKRPAYDSARVSSRNWYYCGTCHMEWTPADESAGHSNRPAIGEIVFGLAFLAWTLFLGVAILTLIILDAKHRGLHHDLDNRAFAQLGVGFVTWIALIVLTGQGVAVIGNYLAELRYYLVGVLHHPSHPSYQEGER